MNRYVGRHRGGPEFPVLGHGYPHYEGRHRPMVWSIARVTR